MDQIGPAEQARRSWERARLNQEIAALEARRASAEREPRPLRPRLLESDEQRRAVASGSSSR
jgi:hypothetical protein